MNSSTGVVLGTRLRGVSRTQTPVVHEEAVWLQDYVVPLSAWDCILLIDVHVVIFSQVAIEPR